MCLTGPQQQGSAGPPDGCRGGTLGTPERQLVNQVLSSQKESLVRDACGVSCRLCYPTSTLPSQLWERSSPRPGSHPGATGAALAPHIGSSIKMSSCTSGLAVCGDREGLVNSTQRSLETSFLLVSEPLLISVLTHMYINNFTRENERFQ